ncbi:CLN3_protein [Hexamita inflata]|uniref:CLN3_protein n=1 Tax=Hexamita inflata TaxID=28002 RepID=A0ABP1JAH4_9EUKA
MEPVINSICFLIFGFGSYFGFFLMLSAAKTMMQGVAATSTVLFCNIVPTIIVKIVLPIIQDQVSDLTCILLLVILLTVGQILASFSFNNVILGLTGVVLSSFGTGIGDVFFYSYSTRFSTKAVGHYQSGTGLASLGSALLYAFLVDVLNCNPKYVIYSFLALPFLLLQCFMISSEFHSPGQQQESNSNNKGYDIIGEQEPYTQEEQEVDDVKIEKVTLKQQFKALSKSTYMYVSILLAITGEYAINQTVNPVIEFPGTKWSGKYFTFSQVACNIGAFLGKSSLSFFKFPRLLMGIPVSVELVLFVLYSCQAVFYFVKWFWLLLCFGVLQGLIAGVVSAQSFYWISVEHKQTKKFALSMATLCSSIAVCIASILGFWYQDFLTANKRW